MCVQTRIPYLSPGKSRTEAEISAASGHSFSTSSRGPHRDLLKPRKDFFTAERGRETRQCPAGRPHLTQFKAISLLLTSEAMFETVLHDDEELLERRVVRVQSSTEAQS